MVQQMEIHNQGRKLMMQQMEIHDQGRKLMVSVSRSRPFNRNNLDYVSPRPSSAFQSYSDVA